MKLCNFISTESEYVALCEAVRDVVWLRRLLLDIGFPQEGATIIYQDNKSTIDMVYGHRNHQASKHINPKYHFSGEAVDNNEIELKYIETANMIADVLTKPLGAESHGRLTVALLNV